MFVVWSLEQNHKCQKCLERRIWVNRGKCSREDAVAFIVSYSGVWAVTTCIYYFDKCKFIVKPCFIRICLYLYPYKAPEPVQPRYPTSRLACSQLRSRNGPASAAYVCVTKNPNTWKVKTTKVYHFSQFYGLTSWFFSLVWCLLRPWNGQKMQNGLSHAAGLNWLPSGCSGKLCSSLREPLHSATWASSQNVS